MAMPSGQRRQEFSFAGSPLRGGEFERARPPRLPGNNALLPRAGEEESRWLQQPSRLGSPESATSGGSGTPSPQFWGKGQYQQQQHRLYPASTGSSPSRAQAIAGYRREMLDLVRGLPESAYELSLRDIVERSPPSPPPPPQPLPPPPPPPPSQQQEARNAAATATDEKQSGGGAKKQGRKQRRTMGRTRSRSLERSVSLDTGLLIKLFLPLSVGGKKKKVSPKPPTAAKDSGKMKKKQGRKEAQEEEEWWKKSEFSEAGSSNRTSSTNSTDSGGSSNGGGNGNGNRNGGSNPKDPTGSRSRKRIGCYGFFRENKSANGGTQD